jgi:hypothetical protein
MSDSQYQALAAFHKQVCNTHTQISIKHIYYTLLAVARCCRLADADRWLNRYQMPCMVHSIASPQHVLQNRAALAQGIVTYTLLSPQG